jgi:hypothetical protein
VVVYRGFGVVEVAYAGTHPQIRTPSRKIPKTRLDHSEFWSYHNYRELFIIYSSFHVTILYRNFE